MVGSSRLKSAVIAGLAAVGSVAGVSELRAAPKSGAVAPQVAPVSAPTVAAPVVAAPAVVAPVVAAPIVAAPVVAAPVVSAAVVIPTLSVEPAFSPAPRSPFAPPPVGAILPPL